MSAESAYEGYFADPFLVRTDDGYIAYGSGEPFTRSGASFQALASSDLRTWRAAGTVLTADESIGTDVWAPEVVHDGSAWWMYYSAGFGIADHHLRVACAGSPLGPFIDCGIDLTPDEPFAIDPHPFRDVDGSWYLFYAHDVLEAERPGTHLVMRPMASMTTLIGTAIPVLAPNAHWQRYEANRLMYGRRMDWYTLEGPTVVRRGDQYVLFYSGGSWEGPDYGVSYATAARPTGPWTHVAADAPTVLGRSLSGQRGPGHNSVLQVDDGSFVIAYHAWNEAGTRRTLHVERLHWDGATPSVDAAAAL